MNILRGIEDVPAIAESKCRFCGGELPDNPWFSFVKESGQMYLVPICDNCDENDSAVGAKAKE